PWIAEGEIGRLNGLLEDLATETGCIYVDVNSHFHENGVRECLAEDGIHISDKGYGVWSGVIEKIMI
ncbi:GDSL family lipase, partial [Nitrospirota bacterium]